MNFLSGSGLTGTRAALVAAGTLALMASGSSWAQTVATINGTDVSTEVLNMYLESRTKKPAASATAEERSSVLDELKDIYLLTTQPSAKEIAEQARIKATIELQTRGILAQAVASDFVAKNPASDEEIMSAYEAQVAQASPMEFKARHILVETQGEAVGLIKELDDGADFAALAKEKSTGPSGANGGDLGWFGPDQMVAPFSKAVAALGDGEFSESPVQTQFGWHVILREESRQSKPPTLESVREGIKQRIEQEKLQSYLERLRATLND